MYIVHTNTNTVLEYSIHYISRMHEATYLCGIFHKPKVTHGSLVS